MYNAQLRDTRKRRENFEKTDFIFFVFFLSPIISNAEIYKCVDRNGEAMFVTEYSPGCTLLPDLLKIETKIKKKLLSQSRKPSQEKDLINQEVVQQRWLFRMSKRRVADNMTKFRLANDFESVKAYVAGKKCLVMKGGLHVTLIDSPECLEEQQALFTKVSNFGLTERV